MSKVSHFSVLATIAMAMMITGAVGLATNDLDSAVAGFGCSPLPDYKYVNAAAFTHNLDSVLQSILSNLSSNGFATSIQNKSGKADPVFGLAACRKYLNASECSECVKRAQKKVTASCPTSNGARIHLDGCFFRYENNSFFDQSVDGGHSSNCSSTIDSDPQKLYLQVQELSTLLIANASANNGFAVGSTDGSLYGLAQCWHSLSSSGCKTCLTAAQSESLACPPRIEGRGLEAGCFMRYSTYSFFTRNQTSSCMSFRNLMLFSICGLIMSDNMFTPSFIFILISASTNSTSSTPSTPSAPSSSGKTSSKIRSNIWGTALMAALCLVFCGRISLD